MGGNEKPMGDTLTICSGCRATDSPAKGGNLAKRLESALAGSGTRVALVDCMIVCGEPVTVSFRAEGKAAYLFSGVNPETQAENLVTFARLYADAADGIVDDVRPCGDLRFRLVGRIPA
jgi:predicted metal-binding protein